MKLLQLPSRLKKRSRMNPKKSASALGNAVAASPLIRRQKETKSNEKVPEDKSNSDGKSSKTKTAESKSNSDNKSNSDQKDASNEKSSGEKSTEGKSGTEVKSSERKSADADKLDGKDGKDKKDGSDRDDEKFNSNGKSSDSKSSNNNSSSDAKSGSHGTSTSEKSTDDESKNEGKQSESKSGADEKNGGKSTDGKNKSGGKSADDKSDSDAKSGSNGIATGEKSTDEKSNNEGKQSEFKSGADQKSGGKFTDGKNETSKKPADGKSGTSGASTSGKFIDGKTNSDDNSGQSRKSTDGEPDTNGNTSQNKSTFNETPDANGNSLEVISIPSVKITPQTSIPVQGLPDTDEISVISQPASDPNSLSSEKQGNKQADTQSAPVSLPQAPTDGEALPQVQESAPKSEAGPKIDSPNPVLVSGEGPVPQPLDTSAGKPPLSNSNTKDSGGNSFGAVSLGKESGENANATPVIIAQQQPDSNYVGRALTIIFSIIGGLLFFAAIIFIIRICLRHRRVGKAESPPPSPQLGCMDTPQLPLSLEMGQPRYGNNTSKGFYPYEEERLRQEDMKLNYGIVV